MKCDKIKQELSAWLDGELPDEQARAVSEHVSRCDSCRNELRELEKIKEMIGGLPRKTAPSEIASNVIYDIENPSNREKDRAGIARRFWPVAAAAIIAVVCLVAYRTERDLVAPDHMVDSVSAPALTEDTEHALRHREQRGEPRARERYDEDAIARAPGAPLRQRDMDVGDGGAAQMLEELPGMQAAPEEKALELEEKLVTRFSLVTDEPEKAIAQLRSSLRLSELGREVAPPEALKYSHTAEQARRNGDEIGMDAHEYLQDPHEEKAPVEITLNVPVEKYSEFMIKLAELGEVTALAGDEDDAVEEKMGTPVGDARGLDVEREVAEDREYLELTITIIVSENVPGDEDENQNRD